jgi:hypothetical protein
VNLALPLLHLERLLILLITAIVSEVSEDDKNCGRLIRGEVSRESDPGHLHIKANTAPTTMPTYLSLLVHQPGYWGRSSLSLWFLSDFEVEASERETYCHVRGEGHSYTFLPECQEEWLLDDDEEEEEELDLDLDLDPDLDFGAIGIGRPYEGVESGVEWRV